MSDRTWFESPAETQTAACGGGAKSDFVTKTMMSSGQKNYSYCYDKSTYTSLWTAYTLSSGQYSASSTNYDTQYSNRSATAIALRTIKPLASGWSFNPDISQSDQVNVVSHSYQVNVGSTTSSGYDDTANYYARGHCCPNADRSGNSPMQSQTYYVTNCTPQIQNGFNNGVWSSIEEVVRFSAGKTTTLYVITGPAFSKGSASETITHIHPVDDSGKSVSVPNYYWKAMLKVKKDASGNVTSASAIAFWVKHAVTSSLKWYDCLVSVDNIESWTGLDLFVNLPDNIEAAAESNSSWTTFTNF